VMLMADCPNRFEPVLDWLPYRVLLHKKNSC
jgi:hypothetical protein